MSLRPATDADRDAVLALGVAEEAAWFGEPKVGTDEVGEWIDDEGGLDSGVVALAADDRARVALRLGLSGDGEHRMRVGANAPGR